MSRRRRLFPLYAQVRDTGPAPVVPVVSVLPAVDSSGGNSVGDELSVDDGTWTNGPILEYQYRWTRAGTPITGETANAYTLAQPDDPGEAIGCQVRARNAAGWSAWATATGAVTCRPYLATAPVVSGTPAVGQTLSRTAPTWLGATSSSTEWVVDGSGTGNATASYVVQVGDEGLVVTCDATASNAGGSTGPTASNALTIRPYWSVNPSYSGTLAVGQTLTGSGGTVDGETTGPTYEWIVDGVGTGDTDTSYVVQVADAGKTVVYRGTASNAGGASTADSTSGTVVPYWSAAPTISAGSEPWPGGTVTGAGGTVAGATSGPTYEWILDGSGTGDTDTTYTPAGSATGDALLYRGSASNAGGASTADSDSVTIVQIEGVNRANEADDWLTNSTTGIPADFTLLAEVIGISASSNGTLVSIGRQPGAISTRRELALLVLSSGSLQGILRDGAYLGALTLSPSGMLDGITRHIVALDQASGSSAAKLVHIVPGGAVTQTSAFSSGSYQNPANGGITDQEPAVFRRGAALVAGGIPVTQFAGIVNVVALNRRLTDTDYSDIAAAGSLQAWGAYTDADLRWSLRPDPATSEGDALTNASTQLDGATYTIQAGTSDCTLGGLNEAL